MEGEAPGSHASFQWNTANSKGFGSRQCLEANLQLRASEAHTGDENVCLAGRWGGTLLETKGSFHVQESLYLRTQCNFLYYELRKMHFLKGNTFYVESSETKTPSAIKEVNLRCYDLTFYNI